MTEDEARLKQLFAAQLQSRPTDFAARWLQSQGEGCYTIGSSGHESNAAVALALRTSDPALLHYRSVAFYLARSLQAGHTCGVGDVLDGVASSVKDQISGASAWPTPSGSADADHLMEWSADSVVVASFGDASANHSTTLGAANAAGYLTRPTCSPR